MNILEALTPQKKTVLVFPFNLLSHYLRCLVLANRYSKEEYEISFLHSEQYAPLISEYGYTTFECEQFDAGHAIACSEKFNFDWLNDTDIERIYLSQANAIRSLKADIVIGDVAPSLKMAAESTGTEYIALMNGYMTKYYAFVRKLSKTHKAYWFLKTFPANIADSITTFAEKTAFVGVHEPFRNIRKKYSLAGVKDYLSEIEGDTNLICDLPELFPQNTLPANYKFISPLIPENRRPEDNWLKGIDKSKPVICICMGSTGNWKALGFLNDEKFAAYTIVTAGDRESVLSAPHIISRPFVNLHEVLKRSNLLICHGGNGTIYFGLMTGVYMLCLTNHFEQEWNVQALERSGYGKLVDGTSPPTWEKEIQQALQIQLPPYF